MNWTRFSGCSDAKGLLRQFWNAFPMGDNGIPFGDCFKEGKLIQALLRTVIWI
jgi:hypothetical protein